MNDSARDSDKTAMIKIKATITEYENDINNFDAIKEGIVANITIIF